MFNGIKNKHIILFNVFLVMILNLLKAIINKWPYEKLIIYTIPFLIVFAVYMFIKNTYKMDAYIFCICAILCIFVGNWGNLSGLTFLIFSFYSIKYKNNILVVFAIIIIAIVLKFVLFMRDGTILETIGYCIGFEFGIAIYFNMMHPKQKYKFHIDENIENTQILNFLTQGLRYKEIGDMINLSEDAVGKRTKKMRKKYKCGNNVQLIFKIMENGGIRQN